MAKLYYFDGRGRAELIRLTLAAAGIEFTEEYTRNRETFLKWIDEGKLLFHEVPALEIDGKTICQTATIARYIARKAGLLGKTDDEQLLVDTYYEAGRDFTFPILRIGWVPEEEVVAKCKDQILPKYMPIFNKIAVDNGTGYLVGSSLTVADLSVVEGLISYVESIGKEIFKEYPALQTFYDKVTSEPKVAAYLSGPQRKNKNDDRYLSEVRLSLDR